MIKLAISGATGKMGQALVRSLAVQGQHKCSLATVLHHSDSQVLGQDSGLLSGAEANGIPIATLAAAPPFDVLIDFTQPAATAAHLDHCISQNIPLVIGTTGFDSAQLKELEAAAKSIPVLLAPNTAVGVNLCLALLEQAAKAVGGQADIEIIETHHRNKVDSPSGTALKMGQVIAATLNRDLQQCAVYGREGNLGVRDAEEIGISSIRAGDVIGDHTVVFALAGERIEITHKASNREIYADGALRAAAWLARQDPGWYTMQDVLGL